MDPSCAICDRHPKHACDCELRSLIHAVQESEQRVLSPLIADIRQWVTSQSRAAINADFRAREARRKASFDRWMRDNGGRVESWELERMRFSLRKGISEDWKAAVERYPDVLDYYYSRVGWVQGSEGRERGRGAVVLRRG